MSPSIQGTHHQQRILPQQQEHMAPAVGLGHAATALSLLALGLNVETRFRAGKLLPVGSLWAAHVVGDKRGGGLPGAAEARALRRAGCGALAVSWKAAVEAARTRAGTKKAVATTLQGSSRIGSVGAVVRTAEFRLPVLRETLDTWVERSGLGAALRGPGAVIGIHVRHGDSCSEEEMRRAQRTCSPLARSWLGLGLARSSS